MKRFNGWGDERVEVPLGAGARAMLRERLGPGQPPRDVTVEAVARSLPASRLPAHPGVNADPTVRVRYARGQSFPDLVATRSGEELVAPDGVACPGSEAEVHDLLRFAREVGAVVVPYGGGTSVAGHVNPPASRSPVLTLSLERFSALTHLDPDSHLATFGAGVRGPDLEAALRARGFTLGHFPQSFEYSTLGGWIATRSSGQQSLKYGRIEALFAGGTLVSPQGTLSLPPFPASAAGPDLRQLVLGSEGRLGVITSATVRVTPLPGAERFEAAFFGSWAAALAATRTLAQSGLPLSLLRLSTPTETETNLALSGHARAVKVLDTYLGVRGVREGRCMLLLGLTGSRAQVRFAEGQAHAVVRAHGGVLTGTALGRAWRKNRFRSPYLRNTLWEAGYGVDTLETATTWDRLEETLAGIEAALNGALEAEGERVHAFTHLSHVYPTGSSVYTTFAFRLGADAGETLARWEHLKAAASRAIVDAGATISHQHGVGRDHAPYLAAEKGELGLRALRAVAQTFDPAGALNPGALLPEVPEETYVDA